MQSRESSRYHSLSKALRKEQQKPNPDKETMKALDIELKKIEESTPRDTGGSGYQESLSNSLTKK